MGCINNIFYVVLKKTTNLKYVTLFKLPHNWASLFIKHVFVGTQFLHNHQRIFFYLRRFLYFLEELPIFTDPMDCINSIFYWVSKKTANLKYVILFKLPHNFSTLTTDKGVLITFFASPPTKVWISLIFHYFPLLTINS